MKIASIGGSNLGAGRLVAECRIEPYRGEVVGYTTNALRLADGRELPCDLVVLSTGFAPPRFPFLPSPYRDLVEGEPDGVQLYRHLVHPRIPRLAFAGLHHGLLHIPSVEVSMLWLSAYLYGQREGVCQRLLRSTSSAS